MIRFLVRLANESKASPAEKRQLTKISYEAVHRFGADVGNLRVSAKAVELDLLLDTEKFLQDPLKALEGKIGPILTLRQLDIRTPPN